MSLKVTVTVGDKEFLMKTIPDTTRFDVPSSIALRTLSHELLEKKFLHPVFSLKVLEDHQRNVGLGDFASTFVNGDYFEHEETTLCASISSEAEEEGTSHYLLLCQDYRSSRCRGKSTISGVFGGATLSMALEILHG